MTKATHIVLASAMVAAALVLASPALDAQHAIRRAIDNRPDALVDLRTREGLALVGGQWRFTDARAAEVGFRRAGADKRPSGAVVKTLDLLPRPGTPGFEEARWEAIDPASLEERRTAGRHSFGWYRTTIRIPDRVAALETAGTIVVFEIVVDDYAEIWVDGRLPRVLGQTGGSLIAGFNAPNRVVLTRSARPGDSFDIAVFAANGPLSDPPPNYVWIRSATLDFHRPIAPASTEAIVERRDPALDAIVPPGARIEQLAGGFLFTEGPVWSSGGFLLFSDPNANTIWRWSDADGLSVYRTKSGYSGPDIGEYGQPGSNGLAIDAEGRLTIAEHGNRRVIRLETNGTPTVLADAFEGRRLNSPNDLVYRSDGTLYFTDPPFGLPKFFDDPRRELPFSGVYRLAGGRLSLVTRELRGPNGIAFSPDERVLYVGNWDESHKVVMRYEIAPDGTAGPGRVFCDLTAAAGDHAIDGVKTDRDGHVYVSGPGGVWIFAPDARHLGTVRGPEPIHNFAWGDADGRTLYLTARTGLYRIRLNVPGGRPVTAANP